MLLIIVLYSYLFIVAKTTIQYIKMIDLRSGSQVSQWGKLKYIIHSSDLLKSLRTVVI